MAGDGQGGVWVLTHEDGGTWRLWHANLHREKPFWEYPSDSVLEGDGQGGVWILCKTDEKYKIWHANRDREIEAHGCQKNAKLASDGHGGLWILAGRTLRRVSATGSSESLYDYPGSAKLVTAVHT